ncbi:MAG TPA: hypothetical protein VNL13_02235 [Sulfolobales archaeon]|nr:hypothetical protein [Sulfolobales archaeon]
MKDIALGVGLPTQVSDGDGSQVPFGSTAAHDPAGSLILRVEVEVHR